MVWDDATEGTPVGNQEPVELVGTHLRLNGNVSLGRFGRLSDLINASSGYLRIRDARLLRRNGEPTSLILTELMVNQDEISFIAQSGARNAEATGGYIEPGFGEIEARQAREYVMFTPGHTLRGKVHVFGQTDLAGFVDATDPRFVAVTGVTARSLADRRIISHYDFVLINRTQMIAAAEASTRNDLAPQDIPEL